MSSQHALASGRWPRAPNTLLGRSCVLHPSGYLGQRLMPATHGAKFLKLVAKLVNVFYYFLRYQYMLNTRNKLILYIYVTVGSLPFRPAGSKRVRQLVNSRIYIKLFRYECLSENAQPKLRVVES